jgi:anti-sigma regulatory factor (Ser/Thr protein kinase)
MVERLFPRKVERLGDAFAFVRGFFESNGLPAGQTLDVNLIMEELFVNMVRHARDGTHDIAIGLDWDGSLLTLVMRDFDVGPFNVTTAPGADLQSPLNRRTPGGLGLHLVRRLSDSLRYDYTGRTSTITVTKRLES